MSELGASVAVGGKAEERQTLEGEQYYCNESTAMQNRKIKVIVISYLNLL